MNFIKHLTHYGFTKTTFFDQSVTKYVYIKKNGMDYEISISCNNSIKNNPEAILYFSQLRINMQTIFPDNRIVFNLIVNNIDNIVKRIE